MSLANLLAEAADAYFETGHPRAQVLRPHLLKAAQEAAYGEANRVAALGELETALSAPDAHSIVGAIADVQSALNWRTAEPMQQNSLTRDRNAFMVLVGTTGLATSEEIACGLYFQSAGTVYPSHLHAAEEVYFVISGSAEWQKGDAPSAVQPPGSVIHHASMQPHAMTTRDEPLLAMWAWLGDLDPSSYRLGDLAWD